MKTGIFLDTGVLYRGCQKEFGTHRVDLVKLLDILKTVGEPTKVIAFVTHALNGNKQAQQKFNGMLVTNGYELRVKTAKHTNCEGDFRPPSWNVGITLAVVDSMSEWDTAIIASGDGGLIDLVRYLTRKEKKVIVAGFRRSTSADLIALGKSFIALTEEVIFTGARKQKETSDDGHEFRDAHGDKPRPRTKAEEKTADTTDAAGANTYTAETPQEKVRQPSSSFGIFS